MFLWEFRRVEWVSSWRTSHTKAPNITPPQKKNNKKKQQNKTKTFPCADPENVATGCARLSFCSHKLEEEWVIHIALGLVRDQQSERAAMDGCVNIF